MRTAILTALVLATGCGGGGGEPIMGTVSIDYGSDHVVPDSGAAVEDPNTPGDMIVLIGDVAVDCALDSNERGTVVSFSSSMTATGSFTTLVSVARADGDGIHINGSTGDVTISAIGERVTGSLSVTTTDQEIGTISASGTFDVIACF